MWYLNHILKVVIVLNPGWIACYTVGSIIVWQFIVHSFEMLLLNLTLFLFSSNFLLDECLYFIELFWWAHLPYYSGLCEVSAVVGGVSLVPKPALSSATTHTAPADI